MLIYVTERKLFTYYKKLYVTYLLQIFNGLVNTLYWTEISIQQVYIRVVKSSLKVSQVIEKINNLNSRSLASGL